MILQLVRKWLQVRHNSSRVEILPDHVWISSRAKVRGIRKQVDERSATDSTSIVLVAHFPDVFAELERIATEYSGSTPLGAVLASQLSREAAGNLPMGESDVMDMVVAERHPLPSVDHELVRFAETLPCRSRIVHHLSLDDPLLQFFGTESIRTLLARLGQASHRLGMTEDEPITHRLLTRSIQRAQQRIAAKSIGRYDADSAAAWLERNADRP